MIKFLEERDGGKKRNRHEISGSVDASLPVKGNNNEEQPGECNVEAGESGGAMNDELNSPLHRGKGRAQSSSNSTPYATYGATEEDNHFDIDEESSDASSQYSNKMGLLTAEDRKAGNDAEHYLRQSPLGRAYPERTLALLVTLMLELPTLFIISGGSDKLCTLIGRRRYQLLVAFLPLTSAISGNVGLQASTLTTRAVSHLQITKHSYCIWLYKEIVAAAYQGFGMGTVSGIFAYIASGHDIAFGFTIFLAQFCSILTAGFTGTLAPLIFTFVFRRDSGQWGGPLETAIQDIVGSFAMVILSYHVLNWLGPHEISENDMC